MPVWKSVSWSVMKAFIIGQGTPVAMFMHPDTEQQNREQTEHLSPIC